MINDSIFHLLFWKAKAPLKMSTDWLTVLKSRNTRLDLIMSGMLSVLSSPLIIRGEQNLLTTRRPLGWLGSWILSLTEELQSGPLNYKLSQNIPSLFPNSSVSHYNGRVKIKTGHMLMLIEAWNPNFYILMRDKQNWPQTPHLFTPLKSL